MRETPPGPCPRPRRWRTSDNLGRADDREIPPDELPHTRALRTAATVQSTDATLRGLTLSPTDISNFRSGTTGYSVSVANSVSSVTVTPTANHASATITVNGRAVASGGGQPVSVNVGRNTITILVTAQDGATRKTYTVTVNRADDTTPPPSASWYDPNGSCYWNSEGVAHWRIEQVNGRNQVIYRYDLRHSDWGYDVMVTANPGQKVERRGLAGHYDLPDFRFGYDGSRCSLINVSEGLS